eukprot:11541454-Karenia_brevis.AAC.1
MCIRDRSKRSSTYIDFGNQKEDGWFGTAAPPQRSMASVRCFSQWAPDSGWPYNALTKRQTGRSYF